MGSCCLSFANLLCHSGFLNLQIKEGKFSSQTRSLQKGWGLPNNEALVFFFFPFSQQLQYSTLVRGMVDDNRAARVEIVQVPSVRLGITHVYSWRTMDENLSLSHE